jgi:hypothetical protein
MVVRVEKVEGFCVDGIVRSGVLLLERFGYQNYQGKKTKMQSLRD